jgi:UDP-glucose 4-epimerase
VSDGKTVEESVEDCEFVFHLAALADIVPSINDPISYFHANVSGTAIVMDAAKRHGVKKFVYAASSSCYGLPLEFPTPESAAISPQYPYALTKWLGEEIVRHWGSIYQIPWISRRLFKVFGPRSRTSGTYGAVFGVFLAQKLAGKALTVVGDGNQSRDFTFVTDVARAFVEAAESSVQGESFNVGSGGTYTVNHLTSLLGGERTTIPERPGEPRVTYADTGKISRVLGWKPEVSFETGVEKVLTEIDYWKKAPVWEPDSIAAATVDWFKYLGNESEGR